MALQLPPPPHDPRIHRPPPPAHPPTLANVYEAHLYTDSVQESRGKLITHFTSAMLTMSRCLASEVPDCATIDGVGRAILYESSVAQVASAAVIGPGS